MTSDTTNQNDKAAAGPLAARNAAARQQAHERQANQARLLSFGAALLISAGLAASVWYGRTLAAGPAVARNDSAARGPVPVPSAFHGSADPGFLGNGQAFAGARRPAAAAYAAPPSVPITLVPVNGPPADRYVTPLRQLVDEVNRSEAARYWQGGDHADAGPSPTQVLTAVDALESLTSVTTHPRRYPPELRPYAKAVSLELRNYLKITTLAIGTGERTGDLQASAARHLDRCNQAIMRLDTVARSLASGGQIPPSENAILR